MASINVRQKIAVAFYSLIETQAAAIGRAIEHRLRPFLKEGETLPDVALVLVLMARMVAAAVAKLMASLKAREDELDDGVEPRTQRDLAALVVRRKLVELRTLAAAFFGRRRSSDVLGLTGPTAEAVQPELLCQQARTAVDHLLDPRLEAPGISLRCAFDPVALARNLAPDVTALRQALDAVERHQLKADSALAAKQEAMGEVESVRRASVLVMKGFIALAGRKDLERRLAALLRPKRGNRKGGAA